MSWNDTMEKALAQARELHRQTLEAANKAAEDMKPHLQTTLRQAQDLQATLSKHATEMSASAAQSTETANGHLSDFIRMGGEAMRQSAEDTRATAVKMTEHAKKVVDAAVAATAKKPE
jgi:DNA anti-recombination protein RmuC